MTTSKPRLSYLTAQDPRRFVLGSARAERNAAGEYDVVVTLADGTRHVTFWTRDNEKGAARIASSLNSQEEV